MTPFFVHIPKTAGSSLRTLITLNYAPGDVASIYGDLNGVFEACAKLIGKTAAYKLIQGHIPHGSHLNLGLKSARYFFFLRHPVDRHFSDVAHGFRDPTHGFHVLLMALEEKPEAWATVSDHTLYFRNTATQYLAGTFFSRDVQLPDFHRAVQVVLESEFVGIAERFDESALIMARRLGWSRLVYEKRNVAPNPLSRAVTAEMRKDCESRQRFDMALYQIAGERFDQDARRYGAHLQEAAHQLRELVARQAKARPELATREYLVGDPVSTDQPAARLYSADSPLALWLKGNERTTAPQAGPSVSIQLHDHVTA